MNNYCNWNYLSNFSFFFSLWIPNQFWSSIWLRSICKFLITFILWIIPILCMVNIWHRFNRKTRWTWHGCKITNNFIVFLTDLKQNHYLFQTILPVVVFGGLGLGALAYYDSVTRYTNLCNKVSTHSIIIQKFLQNIDYQPFWYPLVII